MRTSQSVLLLLATASACLATPFNRREVIVTVTETAAAAVETGTEHEHEHSWDEGGVPDFPIHESCNATERTQLRRALGEAVKLASHAREHILRWGNESSLYTKYFGNESTAEPIGWYSRIISADRGNMTFRCDDPDENCATQSGWAGHWRGPNATQETVICPLSYVRRLPLEAVCGQGYTVAESPLNTYFAVDLLHRILHVPQISEDLVSHYAEDYADALSRAVSNSTYAVRDSDVLQYFAIDAYAYDIAIPGVGCSGDEPSSTTAAQEASAPPTPAPTVDAPASTTAAAAEACHTHADGVIHCE